MKHLTSIVLTFVAGLVLAILLWSELDRRAAPPIVISDPRPDATVVIAVEGAVATPGVYALPGDARVGDAITAAGGSRADADLAAINPAQRLRDEAKIVVPTRMPAATNQPRPPAIPADITPVAEPALPGPTVTAAVTGPLNLNRATVAELEALPGLGPVLAQRIVDYRAANGPFQSIDELAEVDGISPRMVEELRPLLVVEG